MRLSLLDVQPTEAHRKEILRQAEMRRLEMLVEKQQVCERKPPSPLRLYIGSLLVRWGNLVQSQAGVE
jgi:hypothetical protein